MSQRTGFAPANCASQASTGSNWRRAKSQSSPPLNLALLDGRRKSQKQMAMVLTGQKPIQRVQNGEYSEGPPGSTKSVGCVERSARNLGGPGRSCPTATPASILSIQVHLIGRQRNGYSQ